MSQNTNKQHREIKVVVRDFRDELIKSGYKVVVKNFTKEESHGEFRMSENEDVDIDSKRFI